MAHPADTHPTVVLVVETESPIRTTAVDLLADEGYRVIEAHTADEALTLLDLHPAVRVMVTDADLPGTLDGYALARIVDMRWPGIGVIAISDRAPPGAGDLPTKARFIKKPYASLTLRREVGALAGMAPAFS
jgi:CheY-like chemotaxis protein